MEPDGEFSAAGDGEKEIEKRELAVQKRELQAQKRELEADKREFEIKKKEDMLKSKNVHTWWGFSRLENIVAFTVAAGTVLMGFALINPRPEATKEVLPFATGLIGFLGGLVTAMFKQEKILEMDDAGEKKNLPGKDKNVPGKDNNASND